MSTSDRKNIKSARRRAREFALQGLYAWLLDPQEVILIENHIRASAHGFNKADLKHFNALLYGIIREHDTLSALIKPHIDRLITDLSPVERAVLLIGTYELSTCLEIPYRVIINEAVEITKAYGGTDGYKFVNGVLDKLAPSLRATEIAYVSQANPTQKYI
jgi:N utilization substance protein B